MNEEKSVNPNVNALGVPEMLRNPGGFVRHVCECRQCGKSLAFLLVLTILGCGIFGLVVGFFVDWRVALLDATKMIGVILFSYGICLPSLYVFTCLSGGTMPFVRIAGLGLVCTAMMGCVMAALSPILWLFAVSTASVGFFTVFALAIAAVAAIFARRPIHAAAAIGEVSSTAGLRVWFVVFVIVALQAVTLVRPMLSPLGERATPPGKCFFIRHFCHALFEPIEEEGNGDKEK